MLINTKILKWGNSLAIRITGPVRAIPKFKAGMEVDVQVSEEGIQVSPTRHHPRFKLRYKEADLLKNLTLCSSHADEIATLLPREFGEE